jgi:hypothetical protein
MLNNFKLKKSFVYRLAACLLPAPEFVIIMVFTRCFIFFSLPSFSFVFVGWQLAWRRVKNKTNFPIYTGILKFNLLLKIACQPAREISFGVFKFSFVFWQLAALFLPDSLWKVILSENSFLKLKTFSLHQTDPWRGPNVCQIKGFEEDVI